MAFLLAKYCGFTEHHPRDRNPVCLCLLVCPSYSPSIQSREFCNDYLSDSISEDLETLIRQSDKVPILIISHSRATLGVLEDTTKTYKPEQTESVQKKGKRKLTITSTDEQFIWKNNLYWTRHILCILFCPNAKPRALDIKVFTYEFKELSICGGDKIGKDNRHL